MSKELPEGSHDYWFNGRWGTLDAVQFFDHALGVQLQSGICEIWATSIRRLIDAALEEPANKDSAALMQAQLRAELPLAMYLKERLRGDNGEGIGFVCGLAKINPFSGELFETAADYPIEVSDANELIPPDTDHQARYSEEQRVELLFQYQVQKALGLLVVSSSFIH